MDNKSNEIDKEVYDPTACWKHNEFRDENGICEECLKEESIRIKESSTLEPRKG